MKNNRPVFVRVSLVAALALGFGLAQPAAAAPMAFTADKAHSRVSFMAYTKLFDTLGVFKKWNINATVDPENLKGMKLNLTVDVASVDTDNESRDKHLRKKDFFWVEKHAKATFVVKSVNVKSADEIVVTGPLTIRGVTKKMTVPVSVVRFQKKGREVMRLKGKFQVDRNAFGVDYKPGLLMPNIKDTGDVQFDLNLLGPKP